MNLRLFAQILAKVGTTSAIATLAFAVIAATTSNQPSYAGKKTFFCDQEGGVPVTKVRTSRGNETLIRWVVEDFKKFPPLQRCQIVSNKFQKYNDNGKIFIISRDNLNGYPVLCISDRKNGPCTSDNILVTLKPGTDAGVVFRQMVDFRRGVGVKPIELSGSYYFTNEKGDLCLDVKQLVDSSDGKDNN